MLCHLYPRFCIRAYVSVILTGISMLVLLMATSISASPQRRPGAELGLDVLLPSETTAVSLPVMIRGGSRIIPRRLLKISDPSAAGQLTAVQLEAEMTGDVFKVRVSVIYCDISKQEWWKDKQEKLAGSYLIREGEPVRPSELWEFGIEPFEMKVIGARPIVFKAGEGPPVTNETTSLEVARLEKHLDGYRLYEARNIALVSMGQNGGIIRERAQQNDDVSTAKSLRQVLEDLKQTFVKIVSADR